MIFRFDYKFRGLPYFLYVKFSSCVLRSTIARISRKLDAYYYERVSSAELESAKRHDIPIMDYSAFKSICKGKLVAPPVKQSVCRHLFDKSLYDSPY